MAYLVTRLARDGVREFLYIGRGPKGHPYEGWTTERSEAQVFLSGHKALKAAGSTGQVVLADEYPVKKKR